MHCNAVKYRQRFWYVYEYVRCLLHMWVVCSASASTTESCTLEGECRTLVTVQAFFEHKNSYEVQIYTNCWSWMGKYYIVILYHFWSKYETILWCDYIIISSHQKTAIVVQCDKCPVWCLGGKTPVHNYFGRISSPFYLWKVPNSTFSVRPYSVTYRFFLAFLLLDKKAWEVARHVFCYCLDINLSQF